MTREHTSTPRSALIIDGSGPADGRTQVAARALEDALEHARLDHSTVVARDLETGPCTGCFGCWVKTPGECIFGGPTLDIARTAIAGDLLILVTPVTFGGYSSEAKKVLDRIVLAFLQPFFTTIGGEFHHPARYQRLPEFVVLGTLPSADDDAQRVFETLVGRNAINLHSLRPGVAVAVGDPDASELAAVAHDLLARVGVTPARVAPPESAATHRPPTPTAVTQEVAR